MAGKQPGKGKTEYGETGEGCTKIVHGASAKGGKGSCGHAGDDLEEI